MFQRILVANRGEIAARLFRAGQALGVRMIGVFAEPDEDAAWLRPADESYPLGGTRASENYLNQTRILEVATAVGAEAIHPGYGFLSENAAFADACAAAGIIFIGPAPAAMRALGDKAAARRLAEKAGVPVVPGVDGASLDDGALAAAAADIGYPVLVKASAGGGGKGMRIVPDATQLPDALRAARSEAQSSFGDAHILLEKYFSHVHHVEIQILADDHGNVRHLFERECSIQRRYQKIIEESPAPILREHPETRTAMAEAAVALARAAGYVNAGTVEFIVTPDGAFYFLEMNTRLQVEHPVTEMVTGLDLAQWQIRIAAGEPFALDQEAITSRGHAIECRVYAEDPALEFLPSIGEIVYYRAPHGPGIRVDDGVATGSIVSPYYDPMLAKIIVYGADRAEAIAKMRWALRETAVLGVTTNIPYLLAILAEPAFQAGHTPTRFLADHLAAWSPTPDLDAGLWAALAAYEALRGQSGGVGRVVTLAGDSGSDPWATGNGWRNVPL